jgi:hypothetical protein
MEETASGYGGQPVTYCISSRGQPTRGGPTVSGLEEGPNTVKNKTGCYEMLQTRVYSHKISSVPKLL